MSDWKKNKVVGVVAGIILVLGIIILIKTLTAEPKKPLIKGNIPQTPANTPFISK